MRSPLLLLLLLQLIACETPHKSTNPFLGSWYQCDYLGQLSEFHVFEDDIVLSFGGTSTYYDAQPYKIINDTLRYYDTLYNFHDEYGNPVIIKMQAFLSNDQLNLLWGREDSVKYNWQFMKMPPDLLPPKKNDSSFLEYWQHNQFYEREKYFNCHDQRSKKQKRIDSLRMEELIKDIL